jgi:hypothetical protein
VLRFGQRRPERRRPFAGQPAGLGLAIRVATVPAPHDPDSFIKEFGGGAFAQLIENARGFFDYYLDRLCALHDAATDRGRRAIVQGMAEALHKAGSEVLRDTYAQKTALRLGVAAEAMRQEFRKSGRAPVVENEESAESTEPGRGCAPTQHEWWLLRVLLEGDDQVGVGGGAFGCGVAAQPRRARNRVPAPAPGRGLARRGGMAFATGKYPLAKPGHGNSGRQPAHPEAAALVRGSPTRDGIVKILRDKDIDRRLAELNRRLASGCAGSRRPTSCWGKCSDCASSKSNRWPRKSDQ